ncbi:hypothetical protein L208DRAFT_1412306 [Tricholoma matsutake]|nr:hypothetical protein L208DRAFT_1412306 [Tricholoma matsutake 945]
MYGQGALRSTARTNHQCAINAPQLEVGHFLLSDSRGIDFVRSTFLSTIKELLVSTPCYSLTTLGSPTMTQASGTCWMYQNFLAMYPEVESAVIAVHGLQALPSELPRVHIDMPVMEQFTLAYPEWRLIEGQSESGESSDKSNNDTEDEDGIAEAVTSWTKECYSQGA